MAYSTTNIITWAKISQALYVQDKSRAQIGGGFLDTQLDQKLYIERKSLQWEYDQNPASDYLYKMNAYVFALCGKYIFKAMTISGGSGSPATPVVPGSSYIFNELNKVVGTGDGPTNGLATYTHTDLVGGTDLNFILVDGMPLAAGSDFSFDPTTGTITLLSTTWITGSRIIIPYNQLV